MAADQITERVSETDALVYAIITLWHKNNTINIRHAAPAKNNSL